MLIFRRKLSRQRRWQRHYSYFFFLCILLLSHFVALKFFSMYRKKDPLQCQTHALSNSINVKWLHICEYKGIHDACAECSLEAIIFTIINEYQWNIFFILFNIFYFGVYFFFFVSSTVFRITKWQLKPVKIQNCTQNIRWNRMKIWWNFVIY